MNVKAWATPTGAIVAGAGLLLVAGAVLWFRYRDAGGARQLGEDIAGGVLDAATGLVAGAGAAITRPLGLSTPSETIDTVERVREIIGQQGFLEASKRATAGAFFKAALAGPTYYGNEGRRAPLPPPTETYPGSVDDYGAFEGGQFQEFYP